MEQRKNHSWVLITIALLVPSASWALNIQHFKPTGDPYGGVTLHGSELKRGESQLGVFVNWANEPLEFSTPAGTVDLVDWILTTDLTLSTALTKWWSVTVNMPLHLTDVDPIGPVAASREFDLGDVYVASKLMLRDPVIDDSHQWGFALVPFITIPTGDEDRFISNENVTGGAHLVADRWMGDRNYVTFNVGFRAREEETIGTLRINHEVTAGLGYVVSLLAEGGLQLFLEAVGSTTTREFLDEEISSYSELLGGIRTRGLEKKLAWVLGAGRLISGGYGGPELRLFSGLTYAFGGSEPAPPPPAPVVAEPAPPPPPPPPSAPSEGTVVVKVRDQKGGPISVGTIIVKDSTGSVVHDAELNAAIKPLPAGTYTIAIASAGFVPTTEEIDVIAGERTIRDIVLEKPKVKGEKIELRGIVLFKFGSDEILPQSHAVLEDVVVTMRKHPEIKKIRIEAHTDSTGPDNVNLDLSKKRASRVLDYLVTQGIERSRFTWEGFGESRPVASNETKDGRAKNRRVEFVVIETGEIEP